MKYNDKIIHQSKILKYYLEGENKKKIQKDIDKIKKISKNKKYFISAKDLALADSLLADGYIYLQILDIMIYQKNMNS